MTGKAERIYEILPDKVKKCFTDASKAFCQRLNPIRREALISAQLMRRRQRVEETVESYAEDFESLFESSYGRRTGMDEESKEVLKRDLFTQGLKLKW